ncbi:hypothetical protein GCM10020331_080440 [Ectobacillus funiculus]
MKQVTNITVQDERRMYKWKCIQRLIEKYSEKCQRFGITGIDFIDFIQSLTLQQIQMMVMDLDCIN